MSLAETIAKMGGSAAIEQVAQQFGLDNATAAKAVGMLLPAIAGGMQRNSAQEGGAAALLKALSTGNHASYLNDPSSLSSALTSTDGIGILGHVLGSKDVSRAVAATVAGALGIENETVKRMLPVVAAMAMSGLAAQSKAAAPPAAEAQAPAAPADLVGQLGKMLNVSNAGSILGSLFG